MPGRGKDQYRRVRVCSSCGHVWRARMSGSSVKCPHCRKKEKR